MKTTYYYIGTKKNLKKDLKARNFDFFISENDAIDEYTSIENFISDHGKRYVHKIILDFDKHGRVIDNKRKNRRGYKK